MPEEDAERYWKRRQTEIQHKRMRAEDYRHTRGGVSGRNSDLDHQLHQAKQEYERRKHAQQQAARRAAAAASAGTGASASSCEATYPHTGRETVVAVDVLAPIMLTMVVYIVMRLVRR
jgi:hypothetical protein